MKYPILLITLLAGCVSCTSDEKTLDLLESAEHIMSEHPDEALSILKTIDAKKISHRSTRARYALRYTQALDKAGTDIASDSLLRHAVDYYDRHGDDIERALSHYYLGCIYVNMHDDEAAMETFMRAEQHASNTTDYYLRGLINSRMGELYCSDHNYDDALHYFELSEQFFRHANATRNEAMAIENQGYTYLLIGNDSLTKKKWIKAKSLYLNIKDLLATHKMDLRLMPVRIKSGENIHTLKQEFKSICLNYYGESLPANTAGIWCELYLQAGNLDSARICGVIAYNNPSLYTEHQIAGCYARLIEIERLSKNFKQALYYSYIHRKLNDSLNVKLRISTIEEIEQHYNNKLLKDSLSQLKLQNRLQLMTFLFILTLLAIIIIITSRLVIRWRHTSKEEMAHAQDELNNLHTVYNEMELRYNEMKQHLNQYNDREQKISKAIEERLSGLHQLIEQIPTTKPAMFIKEFKKYMTVKTTSKYALLDLQYIVNQKYSGIIDHLQTNYPELNKYDLDLCALMCFGFSQTGICYLYDYTDIGSFYNKRSRLRRKLHLPQDCKIEEFIKKEIFYLRNKEASH